MSDLIKGVFKGLKNEIVFLAGAALKSGASNISSQLMNVTSDENQTAGLKLGTLTGALKSSVMATGQDLMSVGIERVKSLSPEDKKSKASKKSARTQRSKGEK
ncbi:hypothetical protein FE783_02275 [Paenibacillus mesophilus]|uniref:hypothetical protein n=1 Tax=Paenibacillus mesophilus TaxID=2582849 RepID=UPI00110EF720|nr:hypothetical protein [Paenibacillus mesophilus]TMV53033.1 hypothetical protein FE783_02275 [Paenibacillus mesophilus]